MWRAFLDAGHVEPKLLLRRQGEELASEDGLDWAPLAQPLLLRTSQKNERERANSALLSSLSVLKEERYVACVRFVACMFVFFWQNIPSHLSWAVCCEICGEFLTDHPTFRSWDLDCWFKIKLISAVGLKSDVFGWEKNNWSEIWAVGSTQMNFSRR